MLNQDTKRRIDAARDILVGKVPDPKAQVEQITTALIYKFMDDMDQESLELGGNATFFVQEYEKYAWNKLLDTRLGGLQRLSLYVEALEQMPQNPQLPELFRSILKGAFLPYRDPETLNLFLKEINGFTYDHSEKLGDAFEYLLSIMSSQGDAGQFRTPRHIIDFIVEVLDPKKDETILDPACGTAGFLISSYKHILKQNTNEIPGDLLTPDDKTRLMSNFVGYDISPDMVRLSLVNMYLHSFPNPNAHEHDTLTSEERWGETYDIIMANPPFMTPKGGIRPHKRFSIQANRSEVLFVDYIAEHLNTGGRAGIIVPEGIIFQSATAYKALRKMLVEKYVYAVVSLPVGIFQPYSGVKTSILLMDKQLAKKADTILFVKVENDGFDLGAQRRFIGKSDLPQALSILQQYTQALRETEGTHNIPNLEKEAALALVAPKAKIAKNGDYNLSGERYRVSKSFSHSNWPVVKISEIAERITKGTTPTTNGFHFEEKGINFIKIESITDDGAIISNKVAFISSECHNALMRSQLKKNDVLFSIAGAFGRVAIVNENVLPANTNQALAIISPKLDIIDPRYLFYILKSEKILREIKNQIVGVAQYNLSLAQVGNFDIPLPPLHTQQEFVNELNSYQKLITGAKQVVENYRPQIKTDPSWTINNLGEVIRIDGDIILKIEGEKSKIHVGGENIEKDTGRLINLMSAEEKNIRGPVYTFNSGQLLYNKVRPYLNKVALPDFSGICSSDMYPITVSEEIALKEYVFYYFLSKAFNDSIKPFYERARMPKINREQLYSVLIPLPPLETQKQIVSQLEEEQKLVEGNKQLIEIFEQKIKDKIAEVWQAEGEAPDVAYEESQADDDVIKETGEQLEVSEKLEIRQAELFSLF